MHWPACRGRRGRRKAGSRCRRGAIPSPGRGDVNARSGVVSAPALTLPGGFDAPLANGILSLEQISPKGPGSHTGSALAAVSSARWSRKSRRRQPVPAGSAKDLGSVTRGDLFDALDTKGWDARPRKRKRIKGVKQDA